MTWHRVKTKKLASVSGSFRNQIMPDLVVLGLRSQDCKCLKLLAVVVEAAELEVVVEVVG